MMAFDNVLKGQAVFSFLQPYTNITDRSPGIQVPDKQNNTISLYFYHRASKKSPTKALFRNLSLGIKHRLIPTDLPQPFNRLNPITTTKTIQHILDTASLVQNSDTRETFEEVSKQWLK